MSSDQSNSPVNSKNTGSQQALRELNMQSVLETLTLHGPQTQAGLARITGLSTGTISNIVRNLRAEKLIITEQVISSGRRATLVSLRPDERLVAGIDVGRSHLRIMLSTLTHEVKGMRDVKLPLHHHPADTLPFLEQTLWDLVTEVGAERDHIVNTVISLPASIDLATHEIAQGNVLPQWSGLDLQDLFYRQLKLPVWLENDANLGALALATYSKYADAKNLLYVKLATGIGAGFAQNRVIYSSSSGLSGEIGHVPVTTGSQICYCGSRGCLETIAASTSLVESYSQIRPGRQPNIYDVVDAAAQGDPAIVRILTEAGLALGEVLATLGNVLAPDVVAIGGPLWPVMDIVLDGVRHTIRQKALPLISQRTEFVVSEFAEQTEARGACALAIQQLQETKR